MLLRQQNRDYQICDEASVSWCEFRISNSRQFSTGCVYRFWLCIRVINWSFLADISQKCCLHYLVRSSWRLAFKGVHCTHGVVLQLWSRIVFIVQRFCGRRSRRSRPVSTISERAAYLLAIISCDCSVDFVGILFSYNLWCVRPPKPLRKDCLLWSGRV